MMLALWFVSWSAAAAQGAGLAGLHLGLQKLPLALEHVGRAAASTALSMPEISVASNRRRGLEFPLIQDEQRALDADGVEWKCSRWWLRLVSHGQRKDFLFVFVFHEQVAPGRGLRQRQNHVIGENRLEGIVPKIP